MNAYLSRQQIVNSQKCSQRIQKRPALCDQFRFPYFISCADKKKNTVQEKICMSW